MLSGVMKLSKKPYINITKIPMNEFHFFFTKNPVLSSDFYKVVLKIFSSFQLYVVFTNECTFGPFILCVKVSIQSNFLMQVTFL